MTETETETGTETCIALTILPRNIGRTRGGASGRRLMGSRGLVRRGLRFLQTRRASFLLTRSHPLAAPARGAEHETNKHLHHAL